MNTGAKKPIVLPSKSLIEGNRFVCDLKFTNGHIVPLYESLTTHGFNQLLGKAKFINRKYGTVLYRGENRLHDGLVPSLFRGKKRIQNATEQISNKIKEVLNEPKLCKELKLDSNAEEKVEAIMQHYGCKTRFLDVVDNHWISLWMGLHRLTKRKIQNEYFTYVPRLYYQLDYMPIAETAEYTGEVLISSPTNSSYSTYADAVYYPTWKEQTFSVEITEKNYENNKLYLFVLLIAAPVVEGGRRSRNEEGIVENNGIILADLRRCLPSIFLRPHAQHALAIKRRGDAAKGASDFDLLNNLVGVIGVRLDRAADWLGNGKFLSQDNLFPPAMFDHGYDILLTRNDIFQGEGFQIAKYV